MALDGKRAELVSSARVQGFDVQVMSKALVAENTFAFQFEGRGKKLPHAEAGAHIDVHLPSGIVRQYSLTHAVDSGGRYEIGVLREKDGRGGSVEICDHLTVGDQIMISAPRNNFPLRVATGKHLLLAGGIGITPLIAMAEELHACGADYHLHVCARTPARAPFRYELDRSPIHENISYHYDEIVGGARLDFSAIAAGLSEGDQVYACGPTPFLDAAEATFAHLPAGRFHLERFKADVAELTDDQKGEFTVQLGPDGRIVAVPADKSILDVLAEEGVDVPNSCCEGVCSTCIVPIISSGEVIHRDSCLYPDEQSSNTAIALCVSRGAPGTHLVIDFKG